MFPDPHDLRASFLDILHLDVAAVPGCFLAAPYTSCSLTLYAACADTWSSNPVSFTHFLLAGVMLASQSPQLLPLLKNFLSPPPSGLCTPSCNILEYIITALYWGLCVCLCLCGSVTRPQGKDSVSLINVSSTSETVPARNGFSTDVSQMHDFIWFFFSPQVTYPMLAGAVSYLTSKKYGKGKVSQSPPAQFSPAPVILTKSTLFGAHITDTHLLKLMILNQNHLPV